MVASEAEGVVPSPERVHRIGVAYALAAIGIWGVIPVLYKALVAVPSLEVVAHRVLWGLAAALIVVGLQDGGRSLRRALASPGQVAVMAVTAALITANWLAFIYAVSHDIVLQSSLGYFIGPLFNVVLGVVLLRERLTLRQVIAILLAAIGVLNHTVAVGDLPWIALTLGGSFALYGFVRKIAHVPAIEGLTIEMLWLALPAASYLLWFGSGTFGFDAPWLSAALIVAGVSTSLPLIWYTEGARRIPFATIGILQFISPSLQFLLAVWAFGEPFRLFDAVTFVCIWVALAVYLWPAPTAAKR